MIYIYFISVFIIVPWRQTYLTGIIRLSGLICIEFGTGLPTPNFQIGMFGHFDSKWPNMPVPPTCEAVAWPIAARVRNDFRRSSPVSAEQGTSVPASTALRGGIRFFNRSWILARRLQFRIPYFIDQYSLYRFSRTRPWMAQSEEWALTTFGPLCSPAEC